MKIMELVTRLGTYLCKPDGKSGQELLNVLERLKGSRIIIIEKCSECPNFENGMSPRPGCRRTNQLLDGDIPTCDLTQLNELYSLMECALRDNYIKTHIKKEEEE